MQKKSHKTAGNPLPTKFCITSRLRIANKKKINKMKEVTKKDNRILAARSIIKFQFHTLTPCITEGKDINWCID